MTNREMMPWEKPELDTRETFIPGIPNFLVRKPPPVKTDSDEQPKQNDFPWVNLSNNLQH